MSVNTGEEGFLILAAEDCTPEEFSDLHRFSRSDERLLKKLIAHGPVLLRGGRGSGKSALMIEASRRLAPYVKDSPAFGVYLSLRHLELLRGDPSEYQRFLCDLVIREVQSNVDKAGLARPFSFDAEPTVSALQRSLLDLSSHLEKRIVLFFDDAAHIGREASLGEFFDLFRTISSGTVSCKAAIYPGVTRFGKRFDVYNDATVLELARSEELAGFSGLFADVMLARYPSDLSDDAFSSKFSREEVASFLGQAVLGNMRAFVFACNILVEHREDNAIGLTDLNETLLELARNHYWPLLEELTPKLGIYAPMVEPARLVGEAIFGKCGQTDGRRYALVFREIIERLSKPFEMLEYSGFLTRREVSRAMKSGGRGARFAVNLCNLLESMPGTRLTETLYERWSKERPEPVEFHRGSNLMGIDLPVLEDEAALEILNRPIETLAKSNAYPYGLTVAKIEVLQEANITTVDDLASASDERLLSLWGVGEVFLTRFRNVVGQAVWM